MSKSVISAPIAALALAGAVFFSAPLSAQESTTTETPKPAETTTTDTQAPQADSAPSQVPEGQSGTADQIESQLSLGEDANTPADLGQPYTKEEIGDWELRCIRTQQEEDPCQMYQLMDDGEGVPVAEFSLFRLPGSGKAKAGATVVVPLETSLPAQVTITVDGGNARRYPYAFCNQVGCYARIGLTEADVNVFKRGANAKITIVPALAPDQKVELALSLKGFTASFEKTSILDQ